MPQHRTREEGMTAMPADGCDPDDPVEILAVLPARYHQQFLADYETAVMDARQPGEYRKLRHALRLWRLRAVAYSDPASRTGSRPPAPAPAPRYPPSRSPAGPPAWQPSGAGAARREPMNG